MDIALDACTIINLLNGNILQSITQLTGHRFFVGDGLLEQELLGPAQNIFLDTLIANGSIQVSPSSLTVQEFLALKSKYDLGDGETETIALCKLHNYYFASDDKRARKCGAAELGQDKVIGTLFLLKEAVHQFCFTVDEALQLVELMKNKGGFLPDVNKAYFQNCVT